MGPGSTVRPTGVCSFTGVSTSWLYEGYRNLPGGGRGGGHWHYTVMGGVPESGSRTSACKASFQFCQKSDVKKALFWHVKNILKTFFSNTRSAPLSITNFSADLQPVRCVYHGHCCFSAKSLNIKGAACLCCKVSCPTTLNPAPLSALYTHASIDALDMQL